MTFRNGLRHFRLIEYLHKGSPPSPTVQFFPGHPNPIVYKKSLPQVNSPNLSRFLAVSVTLMVGFLGGVSLQAIVNLNRLANLSTKLYEHSFTVKTTVLQVKVDILSIQFALKDVVSAQNRDEIDQAIQQIDRTELGMFENFEVIQTQFLGNPVLVDQVQQTLLAWKLLCDRVIQLRESGKTQEAIQLIQAEEKKYLETLQTDLDAIEAFTAAQAITFLEDTKATRIRSVQEIIGLMVGLSGLMLLWIIWMHRLLERGEIEYGSPIAFRGTVQDSSEHLKTDEKLRQAAAVFRSTADGIIITNLKGTIVDINPAFTTITGYSKAEAIGKNPSFLKSGLHDRTFYRSLWQDLSTKGHWRGEIWNRRKDGTIYPELLSINRIENDQGKGVGYVGVFSDISAVKETEERLYRIAHHNPLTHLPNRRLLNLQLENSIQQATLNNTQFAILFIDLDRFKQVNDSLGHSAGDLLLQQVAQRLQQEMQGKDWVAHLNGDEFVVVLQPIQDQQAAMHRAQTLKQRLLDPFILNSQKIYLTSSIGISLFPQHGRSADLLLRNADTAMYQAKANGRNNSCFYIAEMTHETMNRLNMENALQIAMKEQEFSLVYQPQVDFQTQSLSGMEVLIRWHHPKMGIVSPGQFIPMAEQNGLIREIGTWVLESACIQGKDWLNQGLKIGRIAVNVAGLQIQSSNFISIVEQILAKTGFPPDHLELEVTESFMMQNPSERIQELEQLRLMGIQFAVDDFGTGYSSLSYLKQLPIHKLKIDQSFVRDIPADPNDMAIVEAVIALGKALNLEIIAEGVETEEQADFLRKRGCHQAQGYLYSRPLTGEDMEKLLKETLLKENIIFNSVVP